MKLQRPPRISIIIPSYNQGHFIPETIQSILDQGDPHVSIFVFDGGSTDDTVEHLKSFGNKIDWVSESDHGQTDALNKGLRKLFSSKIEDNDIVAYINSDDFYLPDAFKNVREVIETHTTIGWIVGDAKIVDERGRRIQELIRWYKCFFRTVYNASLLKILNPIPQPSVFIRANVAKKVGLFNETLHYTMDYEYWLRLQDAVGVPYFLRVELSAFRIHGASKGTTQFEKQFQEGLTVVASFTNNPLILFLHRIHNVFILLIYRRIK